jgi:hypothetical protein
MTDYLQVILCITTTKEAVLKSVRTNISTLRQIIELIPGHTVRKLAEKHGVDKQARTFTPWSHVTTMMYSQLAHSLSLNDVCDALTNHKNELETIRSAVPPSRNGLSHANKIRNADMAEELFWTVLEHLHGLSPGFGSKTYSGMPYRFKETINVVDSTTISLVANCMSWAKHRRRKAAAKLHMCLDLQSFLPRFAVLKKAKHSDPIKAYELCANLKAGEIVVFDKAYVDFKHLNILDNRDVFWVTRAKDNMRYEVIEELPVKKKIIKDQIIKLELSGTYKQYPKTFRLVRAMVEVNGKLEEMTFITNNIQWAASSVCDLYKARWSIEVFFKQIKQTLQLCDFMGYSENAIRWQVWIALLVYVLLRFLAYMGQWGHSFNRLFTMLRGILWSKFDLLSIVTSYGTASVLTEIRI